MVPVERLEIADTLEALRRELEELVVRGVRTASSADVARLDGTREELARLGAAHLAERLGTLVDATRADRPEAARALLDAWTTLRVFERVLTLDTVADALAPPVEDDGEGEA
ncbi:MAG: hypothetical protein H6735_28415 [Alphaproteobacteria bacterium]|nr:hypothetical protein [Alphaproteobacteria bacterium]